MSNTSEESSKPTRPQWEYRVFEHRDIFNWRASENVVLPLSITYPVELVKVKVGKRVFTVDTFGPLMMN